MLTFQPLCSGSNLLSVHFFPGSVDTRCRVGGSFVFGRRSPQCKGIGKYARECLLANRSRFLEHLHPLPATKPYAECGGAHDGVPYSVHLAVCTDSFGAVRGARRTLWLLPVPDEALMRAFVLEVRHCLNLECSGDLLGRSYTTAEGQTLLFQHPSKKAKQPSITPTGGGCVHHMLDACAREFR